MNDITQKASILYSEDYNMAYLFDTYGFMGETSINLPLQITNNYVENNVSLQDHIAKPPVTITLSGLIGEVVYKPPTTFLYNINNYTKDNLGFSLEGKLTPIESLFPSVGNITQSAISATQYVESSYNRYYEIFNKFRNWGEKTSLSPTQQQYIFEQLNTLRDTNKFVNVSTPWKLFENYAISDIRIRQDATTKYTSVLEVSLQEWREVGTKMTKVNTKQYEQRCGQQRTVDANHGKAQGKEPLSSTIYKMTNADSWGITPNQFGK